MTVIILDGIPSPITFLINDSFAHVGICQSNGSEDIMSNS